MSARNTLPRSTATVLWSLIALGIVLRVLAWGVKGGMHYPDEIFQQLEPAHLLRTGVAWLPWEFGRGLRSWIMPWYYAGLMEVFSWLGVVGHDALRAVNLHNAVLSAAMIPAAFRMGRALCNKSNTAGHSDSAGLWCAALVACWPTVIYFAPHALMGSPSMICLTWGYAFWLEERRASPGGREALWMGFWFGMAGMIRFTSGLHMLVPLADLLLRRRARAIAWLVLGALPGMLTLGLVDLMTWGRPFFSAIEHFRYNFIEGKSSQHGVSPWHFYLTTSFATRVGPGLLLLVPLPASELACRARLCTADAAVVHRGSQRRALRDAQLAAHLGVYSRGTGCLRAMAACARVAPRHRHRDRRRGGVHSGLEPLWHGPDALALARWDLRGPAVRGYPSRRHGVVAGRSAASQWGAAGAEPHHPPAPERSTVVVAPAVQLCRNQSR
ncbi:MAG: hypothetical protein JRG89_07580 [Deltaproteobacteria bacterium]|nr:hypothetical protein [Deltaproteobacteria bacterium]